MSVERGTLADTDVNYPVTFVLPLSKGLKLNLTLFEFFTITQSWQCWHYWQLCNLIYLQFSALFALIYVSKCEIRNQGIHENYISWIQSLLDDLILNGTAKTKLAMLALLHCGVFVKNSIGWTEMPVLAGFLIALCIGVLYILYETFKQF